MTLVAQPLQFAPPLPAPRIGRAVRDAGLAAGLVAGLGVAAWAEATLQAWIPDVLDVPADAEVVTDREIGSSVRMFSFATATDTGPMLDAWEEALRGGGFAIERQVDELVADTIEFSGPGIANAKIVASREDAEGRTLVQFDATLN